MATTHAKVTVGTTATALHANPRGVEAPGGPQSMLISAAADFFIGGPGVTTTNYGFKVVADTPLALDLGPGDTLYGVCATGTVDVYTLRVGI